VAGDDFLGSLDRLLAESAAAEAARERSQERTLRDVAEQEATWTGICVDLAERGTPVVVRTASGRLHRGRVSGVGRDFVVLRGHDAAPPTFVSISMVASLRPQPGARTSDASGHRPPPRDVGLAAVLAALAAERPRVQVTALGDEPLAGRLRSVGADVLTIAMDGDHDLVAHVPLATVTEIVVLDLA
jgi:hypothetical protein